MIEISGLEPYIIANQPGALICWHYREPRYMLYLNKSTRQVTYVKRKPRYIPTGTNNQSPIDSRNVSPTNFKGTVLEDDVA
jgi:hypothetical protein